MSSFKDGTFMQRKGTLGDIAEAAFEERYEAGFARFGIKRPPIRLSSIPLVLRRSPDYLTSEGLVEVCGVGRDQLLKLHLDKLAALRFWNTVFPVRLWIWDSSKKRHYVASFELVMDRINAGHGTLDRFHDGGAYVAIPLDDIL